MCLMLFVIQSLNFSSENCVPFICYQHFSVCICFWGSDILAVSKLECHSVDLENSVLEGALH